MWSPAISNIVLNTYVERGLPYHMCAFAWLFFWTNCLALLARQQLTWFMYCVVRVQLQVSTIKDGAWNLCSRRGVEEIATPFWPLTFDNSKLIRKVFPRLQEHLGNRFYPLQCVGCVRLLHILETVKHSISPHAPPQEAVFFVKLASTVCNSIILSIIYLIALVGVWKFLMSSFLPLSFTLLLFSCRTPQAA